MWPWSNKSVAVAEPIQGEWTKRAAATLRRKQGISLEALGQELGGISQRIYAEAGNGGLLPCEKAGIGSIKELILRRYLDSNYDRIDLEILRWRKKDGTPVFGIFNPFADDNTCCIKCFGERQNRVFVGKSEIDMFQQYYRELNTNTEYRARFIGLIPEKVREEINGLNKVDGFSARRENGPNIWIVSECDWETRSLPPDPLVIVNIEHDAWLVAAFDTTPVERIVSAEFAWKQEPKKPV